jgi:hypothetical protein
VTAAVAASARPLKSLTPRCGGRALVPPPW